MKDNNSFVHSRVKHLQEDVSAQLQLVTLAEAKHEDTKAKAKETTRWVKADIAEIDALVNFLKSPGQYMRS